MAGLLQIIWSKDTKELQNAKDKFVALHNKKIYQILPTDDLNSQKIYQILSTDDLNSQKIFYFFSQICIKKCVLFINVNNLGDDQKEQPAKQLLLYLEDIQKKTKTKYCSPLKTHIFLYGEFINIWEKCIILNIFYVHSDNWDKFANLHIDKINNVNRINVKQLMYIGYTNLSYRNKILLTEFSSTFYINFSSRDDFAEYCKLVLNVAPCNKHLPKTKWIEKYKNYDKFITMTKETFRKINFIM